MSGLDLTVLPGENFRTPSGSFSDKVFFVGRYDITNGGADSVRPLSRLRSIIDEQRDNRHVVLEGIGQAGILGWILPVVTHVIYLTTDLDTCIVSVKKRGHKLSADGVRRGWIRAANMAQRFRSADIPVYDCTRNSAVRKLRELTR